MKIGIDIRSASTNLAGTGTYIRNLYRSLLDLDTENEYFPMTANWYLKRKNLLTKFVNAASELAKIHIQPIRFVKENKLDLMHFPANVCSFKLSSPKIVTIFDLGFLFYPDSFDKYFHAYVKFFLELSARRADAILTISESSKNDIVNKYNIDPNKIWVTYLGVSESWKKIPKVQARRNLSTKFRFADRPYILSLGELIPRKNHHTLLRAYSLMRARRQKDTPDLVFAGPDTLELAKVLKRLAQDLRIDEHVHFCGFVFQNDLVNLLNSAEMLAFISLYEGFGIPLLEAMACEIPILASNVSSIPEVVGPAAVLVDPTNAEEIATGMERILFDSNLRDRLSYLGIQRAKLFTWQKAAQSTIAVYNNFKT